MGKLVPQDPNDEPASELLKRIERENGTLIISKVDEKEQWGSYPASWQLVRLGQIADVEMGQSPDGSTYNEEGLGVPLVNGPAEFGPGPFDRTIRMKFTTAPTKMCSKGDLLVCVRGATTGRTNIAGFDSCIGRGVAALRPYCDKRYFNYFVLNSRESILRKGTGTTFPSISKNDLRALFFPCPPLPEQIRIGSRLDQLFHLCDQLKESGSAAERITNQMAELVVGQTG